MGDREQGDHPAGDAPPAGALPHVDESSWQLDDSDDVMLSWLDRTSRHPKIAFAAGARVVYVVPAADAAALRTRGVFGVAATSASGCALVTTSRGTAILFDAGSNRG